jgi:glycerol-3-phosphate O-acyltransferase / dihydroxyacetone phosphate acyltransferase
VLNTRRSAVQRLLLGLARRAVRLYYRVEARGAAVPATGPVLLVGNHPNGLVDPVLLAGTTRRTLRFLGKAPLFEMPVLGQLMRGLEVLPVYRSQDGADTGDNAATFEAVHAALGRGEVVCLFPEGKSHDEPALAPLKTGAARMALGAEARAGWGLGLVIVPVGLVYRAKPSFRSRVAVWTGAALAPAAEPGLRALFERDERAAVHALNARIAEGLRQVTLELERWEDLPLLELAERILFSERAGRLERLQGFAAALRELRRREPERVAELAERIATFGERLARLGLGPGDLPERLELPYRAGPVARFVLRSLGLLVLGLPLGAAGAVFWFLPNRLAGALPKRFAGPDILATARILAGALFLPLWLGAWTALVAWRAGASWAVLLFLAAPPLGVLALWFRDWNRAARAEVRTFFRLASRAKLRARLVQERARLAEELAALRATLTPSG